MKTIKKIKQSGKAVAGSALLVGATLAGGASMALAQDSGSSGDSYDLGSYPNAPFIDEDGNVASSIVVGDDAQTVDVVSAIDIAGQLGNNAFAEEETTVPGAETTEVDGAEAAVTLRQNLASAEGLGGVVTLDKSDYSQLAREVVEDSDEDEHQVLEQIDVDTTGVSTVVNGTDVLTEVDKNALTYRVKYTPGFESGDTIQMLGNEYTITSLDSGNNLVELGSNMEQNGLELGDSYEHGPYTVEVVDKDESNSEIYVSVSKDGEELASQGLGTGNSFTVDDEALNITADSVFFGSQRDYIDVSSTYTDTTVEQGEDSPVDEDYNVNEVKITDGALEEIELQNNLRTRDKNTEDLNEDELQALESGEAFEGPAEYFSVDNLGLSEPSEEELNFNTEYEVEFTDANALSQTVGMDHVISGDQFDLSGATEDEVVSVEDADGNSYPVAVDSVNNPSGTLYEVTLSYQQWEGTAVVETSSSGTNSTTMSTGYGFDVTVDGAEDATVNDNEVTISGNNNDNNAYLTTQFGADISHSSGATGTTDNTYTGTPASIQVTESGLDYGTETFEVLYDTSDGDDVDAGEIGEINYNLGSNANGSITVSEGDLSDYQDGEASLSDYGTHLSLAGAEGATVMYPEEQVVSEHAIGGTSTSSGEDTTYTEKTMTGFENVGALDTDNDIDTRKAEDTMILVGGPAVNDLVGNLAEDGQTWTTDEYTEGQGLLQWVNTEAYNALIVSGQAGEDTRAAADFLTNYEENSEDLEGSTQLSISTETGQVVE